MFYYLFYPLRDYISGLNIFQYITFRAASAAITALLISFILGPIIIRLLKKYQIGEEIREEGPEHHKVKSGTPTMGGIIILIAVVVPTLLWAKVLNTYVLLILLATIWMGIVGFVDDYLKVVKKLPKGLIGRYKIAGQVTLGLIVGVSILFADDFSEFATYTQMPFFKDLKFDFSYFYIPMVIFIITATSNSVNLTDGIDGLAIGLVGICALGLAVIAYMTGHVNFSDYLNILYMPGAGELTIYCAALVGASLGFLWFNAYPASVFMGDTGSLALGGAIGTLAILLKKELFLIVMGGVFAAETLSVILQVWSFKRRGKRIFKMAPVHHHFELKGWHESKVVIRFWIIGILFALLSLTMFKIR
ncbi:MAG: phospho-N-acetylmuramoyl-pentapeptide-transferase [Calditrichaeota bacterium]|nr:MAG: phospho-N-acetylmuramoyl-pentapeptide-transferase [Calditrichota bacterium]